MITYFLLILGGMATKIFVFLFIKLEVNGRKNIPKNVTNLIFSSNHEAYIDSWLVMTYMRPLWYFIFHPAAIPWNTPEKKNFFNTWWKKIIFSHLRCLPVTRGGMGPRETEFFSEQVKKKLKKHSILWYFEQTRARNNEIGEPKQGVGWVIRENLSRVIPIRIRGMDNVWPVDSKLPKVSLFKKIRVHINYGSPLNIDDLLIEQNNKPTHMAIGQRIKEAVEAL
ncbi:1-acyl-sn-glycerol-3-phosphate acyltransferase [Patescibacteria group bacterium]|nr:1-acyl-sn-glycerol-3-phosphate acyltransferase [Patescibacteria group bacterium]